MRKPHRQFVFEDTVKIESMAQIEDLIGKEDWSVISMNQKQIDDYLGFFGKRIGLQGSTCMFFRGIPIVKRI
jgi:hypothetical protein